MRTPEEIRSERLNTEMYTMLVAALKDSATKDLFPSLKDDTDLVHQATKNTALRLITEYDISPDVKSLVENLVDIAFGRSN